MPLGPAARILPVGAMESGERQRRLSFRWPAFRCTARYYATERAAGRAETAQLNAATVSFAMDRIARSIPTSQELRPPA